MKVTITNITSDKVESVKRLLDVAEHLTVEPERRVLVLLGRDTSINKIIQIKALRRLTNRGLVFCKDAVEAVRLNNNSADVWRITLHDKPTLSSIDAARIVGLFFTIEES